MAALGGGERLLASVAPQTLPSRTEHMPPPRNGSKPSRRWAGCWPLVPPLVVLVASQPPVSCVLVSDARVSRSLRASLSVNRISRRPLMPPCD